MLYICFAKLRLSMLYDRGNFALKFPRLFIISPTPPKKYLNSTFVVYHKGVPDGREYHRSGKQPRRKTTLGGTQVDPLFLLEGNEVAQT